MCYSTETKQAVQKMGSYLKETNWTFYATFTTPYKINLKQGRRLMENYYSYLSELGLKPTIFWIIEPFYHLESGFHIHALIKVDVFEEIKTLLEIIRKAWRRISRGSSISSKTTQIDAYIEEQGANYYVAKYICGKNAEYDIFIDA